MFNPNSCYTRCVIRDSTVVVKLHNSNDWKSEVDIALLAKLEMCQSDTECKMLVYGRKVFVYPYVQDGCKDKGGAICHPGHPTQNGGGIKRTWYALIGECTLIKSDMV